MRIRHLAPLAALSAALAATPVLADPAPAPAESRETTVGVIAGGLLGAVFGGPPGAIAGAAIGGFAGDRAGEASRVGPLTGELARREAARQALVAERGELRAELVSLRRDLERERLAADQAREAATVAEGLEFAIPFRTGSSEPPGEAAGGLDALALFLAAAPDLVLELDGYADPRGSEDYNAGLSLARAEAVRGHLVAAGVDPERIRIAGRGELEAEPSDPETWALQRRVSVRLRLAEDRLAARP